MGTLRQPLTQGCFFASLGRSQGHLRTEHMPQAGGILEDLVDGFLVCPRAGCVCEVYLWWKMNRSGEGCAQTGNSQRRQPKMDLPPCSLCPDPNVD